MLKNKKKAIIVLVIIFAILTIVYFAVISPLFTSSTNEEIPELLDGEVLGLNNRIMLFDNIEQANLKEIKVHNSNGDYGFYKNDDGNFYVIGMESAPFSKTKFSSLVVSAGYTLSIERVTTDCEDLSIYGLDEESSPTYYTITSTDDISHTVYIGNMIPTGAGYYVRCDGRNAVYILSEDIGETLLADLTYFIEPILSLNVSENDYFTIRDFYIFHNDECKIWIDYVPEGVTSNLPTTTSFVMKAPANYVPSTSYEVVLKKFEWFEGTEVVEVDDVSKPLSNEVLLSYGIDIDNPAWVLHYEYSDIDNFIDFSEKTEEGFYYAYSITFNTICKVDAETLDFLEWDLIEYVDENIYMLYLNDIASITLTSDKVNETFKIEGKDDTLTVAPKSTGTVFNSTELQNFRQFYKSILSIKVQDYAEDTSKNNLILTMRILTDGNVQYEFKFYQYSSRRCYYTINGKGDFYVLYDAVQKVIDDAQRVLNGETIDSWAKN